jgi:UDP-galactopyranose mutase
MSNIFDTVIVGAGLAGSVMAERLTHSGKRVLIIEKREHIGGNCFDSMDTNGVLVHRYGPHLFHTDSKRVWEYLSKFTKWHNYHHEVEAFIDGSYVPIPFNLNSLYKLFSKQKAQQIESTLLSKFEYGSKVTILELKNSDEKELEFIANFIYEKVFLNYSAKQWGVSIDELDKEVSSRVPIILNRDNRYFNDSYQAIPIDGYTKLFENMLSSKNISILLKTDYKEVLKLKDGDFHLFGVKFDGDVIFSGMIDELFEYQFGHLCYRSVDLVFETYNIESFQSKTTINYPNSYDYTRVTEFKKILSQNSPSTTILKEYPKPYTCDEDIPYYPILNQTNRDIYTQYVTHAKEIKNLTLLGRLAQYRYYDMDDIVLEALELFERDFDV